MGEIAEDIISGFYCNQCGEMIDGNSPGYPRNCGCSSGSNYIKRKDKKKRSKEERRKRVIEDLYSAKINGIKIFEITPWHIRITSPELSRMLDIFPTNKKYHYVTKDERGEFEDVVEFVKKIMEIE